MADPREVYQGVRALPAREHPLVARVPEDHPIYVSLAEEDTPVLVRGSMAYWLQPEGATAMGVHADPGALVCAPLSDDGLLRLGGFCQDARELAQERHHGYALGDLDDIERVLRGG